MDKQLTLVMDYDGTLHDSCAIYEPAFRQAMLVLEEKGWIEHKEYTTEEIVYWVGFSAAEMWSRFHPELSAKQRESAAELVGRYMRDAMENGAARLYPGTEQQMDALKERFKLIFLSNCSRDYMETHIRIFGLDKWFDEFYCTGDYDFAPKEQVFAEHIYREGNTYIAVGDRMKDLALATNCGLRSVGCLYGFGSPEELVGADVLIDDISQLSSALDKII